MRSSNGAQPAGTGGEPADGKRRLNADTVAGGIGVLFALAYLAAAFAIPEGSFSNAAVGPAALPVVIGAALAVASLALATRGVLSQAPAEPADEPGAEEEGYDEDPPQSFRRFAVVAGMLLAYILLLMPLGYVISTSLFLLGVTMYLDRGRPVRNVVFALLFALIVYFVFTNLLAVFLPAGPLGLGPV